MLTVAELKEALPPHLRNSASQELADRINNIAQDPEVRETMKENVISYTRVLSEGRFKVDDYISAVTYVSFKMMGYNNQESYKRTFPQRYQNLVARGADDKEISAYVSIYNKGKLVNMVLEQTMVPIWVLNQDVVQKAINHQAWLMAHAKSEKVQQDAANSILTHLKQPEATKVDLTVNQGEASGMQELNETLAQLAKQQQVMIAQGMSTREVAHQPLVQRQDTVEGTAKDVTPKP